MKVLQITTLLMLALIVLCAHATTQDSQPMNQGIPAQTVMNTNVCEIAASPEGFDGKLVRIDAYISRGFEDSTLHDPSCPAEALVNMRGSTAAEPRIWAEFADHIDHWHVKGFASLVDDEQLQQLRAVLAARRRIHQMTRATMIGTFYAGKPTKINGRVTPLRGFGHMGCCSLFVISRVDSLETDYANDLNYSWGDWAVGLPEGCYSEQMLGLPTNETIRSWQRAANDGRDDWRRDPRQTAEDQLKKLKSAEFGSRTGGKTELLAPKKWNLKPLVDSRPTETLLESSSTPYLKRYEFIEPDRIARFVIVVARPYWLAKLAGSSESVIWAPVGSSVVSCAAPGARGKNAKGSRSHR